MKTRLPLLVSAVAFLALFTLPFVASGAEPVVCTVPVGTTVSASTGLCMGYTGALLADGGDTRTATGLLLDGGSLWPSGAQLLVQCDWDVYVNSTAVVPGIFDGGINSGAATSGMEVFDFTSRKDPIGLPLNNGDRHIAFLTTDGGTRTCKVMSTLRPRYQTPR